MPLMVFSNVVFCLSLAAVASGQSCDLCNGGTAKPGDTIARPASNKRPEYLPEGDLTCDMFFDQPAETCANVSAMIPFCCDGVPATCNLCEGGTAKPSDTIAIKEEQSMEGELTCESVSYAHECEMMRMLIPRCCDGVPPTCDLCEGGTAKPGDTIAVAGVEGIGDITCDMIFHANAEDCGMMAMMIPSCCDDAPASCDLCQGYPEKPGDTVVIEGNENHEELTCNSLFFYPSEYCESAKAYAPACCDGMPSTCDLCEGYPEKPGDTVIIEGSENSSEITCNSFFFYPSEHCEFAKVYAPACCDGIPSTCDLCEGGTEKPGDTIAIPGGENYSEITCNEFFFYPAEYCESAKYYAPACCDGIPSTCDLCEGGTEKPRDTVVGDVTCDTLFSYPAEYCESLTSYASACCEDVPPPCDLCEGYPEKPGDTVAIEGNEYQEEITCNSFFFYPSEYCESAKAYAPACCDGIPSTCDICEGYPEKPGDTIAIPGGENSSEITCNQFFFYPAEYCESAKYYARACCEGAPPTCDLCEGGTEKPGDTVVGDVTCDTLFSYPAEYCEDLKSSASACCEDVPPPCDFCEGYPQKPGDIAAIPGDGYQDEISCNSLFLYPAEYCEYVKPYADVCCDFRGKADDGKATNKEESSKKGNSTKGDTKKDSSKKGKSKNDKSKTGKTTNSKKGKTSKNQRKRKTRRKTSAKAKKNKRK